MPFDLYLLRSTTQQLSDIHATADPHAQDQLNIEHNPTTSATTSDSGSNTSSCSSNSSGVHSQLRSMATAVSVMPEESAPESTSITPASTTVSVASNASSSSVSSVNTRLPVTLASTPFALTRLLLELVPLFRAVDWLLDVLDWKQPSRSLLVLALWWIACAASEWIYIYLLHWLVACGFLWWYWQRRQVKPTAPHTTVDANGTPIVSASPIYNDDAEDLRAVSRTLDALNARLGRLRLRMKRMAARADLAAGDILRWWLYSYPPWCLFNYQFGPRWSVATLGGLLISWRSPWIQFMYRFITSWIPRVLWRFQRRLDEHQDNPLYAPLIQAVSLMARVSGKERRHSVSQRQRKRRQQHQRKRSSTRSSTSSGSTKHGQSSITDSMLPIPEESRDEPQDTTCPDAQAKLKGRSLSPSPPLEQTTSCSSSDIDDPLFNSISLDGKENVSLVSDDDSDDSYTMRKSRDLLNVDEDDEEEDDATLLAMHTGLTHRIILLEHQRWWVGLGWLTRFLPFDPYPWTDEEGHEAPSCEHFALPAPTTINLLPKRQLGMSSGQIGHRDVASIETEHDEHDTDDGQANSSATQQTLGWKWIDAHWQIDQDTSPQLIDVDGWSYADNMWSGWRSAPWMRAYTRRRRWWRRAMLVEVDQH
ncbi:Peroxin/Dysferlin domain-containing protein [Syncephalis plumigaleata]|nr:Peroxin/Dysferlin domain-containing protein [Syncephalis plumigaleata]